MKSKQRGWIAGNLVDMVVSGFVLAFLIGVICGVFLSFAAPWLWGVLKPWLHLMTA